MSWYDEQLKERAKSDQKKYYQSFETIANTVMGKRVSSSLDEEEIKKFTLGQILLYFKIDLKDIVIPEGLNNVNDEFNAILRPRGIMHREVKLTRGWHKNAYGPMLGYMKSSDKVIALIPNAFSGFHYIDSCTGKKIKVTKKIAEDFDEDATVFYESLPLRRITNKDLFHFLKRQVNRADIVLFLVISGLIALIGLLSPFFTKFLFSEVIDSKEFQLLISIAIFMVSYCVALTLFQAFKTLMVGRVDAKMHIALESAMMARVLSLPPSFFEDKSSGDLTVRIRNVSEVSTIINNVLLNGAITSIFSIVYIFQIFNFAPILLVPSIISTILICLFTVYVSRKQIIVTTKAMNAQSLENGVTYTTLSSIQKIKLTGAEKRLFARWTKYYNEVANLSYSPGLIIKISETITLTITLVTEMIIYYLSIRYEIATSDYYAFQEGFAMVSAAFLGLSYLTVDIARIKPSLDLAKPIFDATPEINEGRTLVKTLRGSIELSHVSFSYDPKQNPIFNDFNLKINPGDYVAIVGKTGCGKSTLVKLLLGFETPQKGAIYYDRYDVKRLDMRSLRRKIGTVIQGGSLFSGDIYSNIVITAPETTLDGAWEAAELAAVADDIRDMPMQMATLISEGQGGISGGQKQRILIARALASKPKVLIFDEATSALDNYTQKKVSEAIDALKCTRIVIAHRLSTIRHCNRIVVIDQGKIVEEGTYDDLIAKKGFFAELVDRQRIDN